MITEMGFEAIGSHYYRYASYSVYFDVEDYKIKKKANNTKLYWILVIEGYGSLSFMFTIEVL